MLAGFVERPDANRVYPGFVWISSGRRPSGGGGFRRRKITSDAEALLLGATDWATGLIDGFAACFSDAGETVKQPGQQCRRDRAQRCTERHIRRDRGVKHPGRDWFEYDQRYRRR